MSGSHATKVRQRQRLSLRATRCQQPGGVPASAGAPWLALARHTLASLLQLSHARPICHELPFYFSAISRIRESHPGFLFFCNLILQPGATETSTTSRFWAPPGRAEQWGQNDKECHSQKLLHRPAPIVLPFLLPSVTALCPSKWTLKPCVLVATTAFLPRNQRLVVGGTYHRERPTGGRTRQPERVGCVKRFRADAPAVRLPMPIAD